jgi:hypothetical protein
MACRIFGWEMMVLKVIIPGIWGSFKKTIYRSDQLKNCDSLFKEALLSGMGEIKAISTATAWSAQRGAKI